jgi:hypothetical protein
MSQQGAFDFPRLAYCCSPEAGNLRSKNSAVARVVESKK